MWWHMRRNQISSFGQTSLFKSAGASVQSTTGSRGVRISGSNVGYTMLRGSVKSTGYPLHSPVSHSLSLPCVTVCQHISTGLYCLWIADLQGPPPFFLEASGFIPGVPRIHLYFCTLLFNSVSDVFLLLCLCILIDKYALFCVLFANWYSPTTLTEVFSLLFPQL